MTSEMAVTLQTGRGRGKPKEWQKGVVAEIIVETPETNTLRISLPDPLEFLPGQYYNIRIPVEGRPRPIQRAYSVGSSPKPDFSMIDVGVREMTGGLVSPVLVRGVAPGHELEVRGPYGNFTWTTELGGPVLLIGAGSGVVPLMSMIRYQAAVGSAHAMHLLYSSKSHEYVIYGDDLAELDSEYDWLSVSHTFTRDPHDTRARFHRRIDKEMVTQVMEECGARLAYICGPPEMVEDAERTLVELGMAPEAVHTEKYD